MSRFLFNAQNKVGETYSFPTNKNGTFYWYIDKHDPAKFPFSVILTPTPSRNHRFDLGDGSQPVAPLNSTLIGTTTSGAHSHTYSDGSDKHFTIETDKLDQVRYFSIGFSNTVNNVFTGKTNLDLTPFKKIYFINFQRNTNITGVTFNTDGTQPIYGFYGNQCDLSGNLDLSGLNMTDVGSGLSVHLNSQLNEIIFPSNVKITGNNFAYNCNLSGHYDFSSWSGVSSQFRWQNNSVTAFTFPTIETSAGSCFNGIEVQFNDLRVLDISPLKEFGRIIRTDNNTNLTQILFPSNDRNIIQVNLSNCDYRDIDFSGLSGLTLTQSGGVTFRVDTNSSLSAVTTTSGLNRIVTDLETNFNIGGTNLPSFDLSGSTIQSGLNLRFADSPELTYIVLPTHPLNYSLTTLDGNDCPKLSNIDISCFDFTGTFTQTQPRIAFNNCTSLSGLTSPLTGKTGEVHFFSRNCNLSNTLDLSMYKGLMKFDVSNNSSLTGLTLPNTTSTQTLTDASIFDTTKVFEANDCDLGYVDFKQMSGVTLNSSSTILLQNNGMTAGEVNHILDDFTTTTWDDVTLDISGSNAAPDTTSGGYNGIAALSTLTGGTRNWTVTTS